MKRKREEAGENGNCSYRVVFQHIPVVMALAPNIKKKVLKEIFLKVRINLNLTVAFSAAISVDQSHYGTQLIWESRGQDRPQQQPALFITPCLQHSDFCPHGICSSTLSNFRCPSSQLPGLVGSGIIPKQERSHIFWTISRAATLLLHFSSTSANTDVSQITLLLSWDVITSPLPLYYLQCQGKVTLTSLFCPRYNVAVTGELLSLILVVSLCLSSNSYGLISSTGLGHGFSPNHVQV